MDNFPDKRYLQYDLSEALLLRFEKNLSFQQIADHYGIPKSTIHSRLQAFIRLLEDPELNRVYAERRADFLNAAEASLLSRMFDDQKLKDASVNNIAYAFDKIQAARRLEQGLSTANTASNVRVKLMPTEEQDALKRALASMFAIPEMEGKLGAGPDLAEKADPIDV
jgi:predicted DNA-binding protein YlxM (UPF0122 family)